MRSSPPSGPGTPLRVLVVDDDPDSLERVAQVLGSSGCSVRACTEAREALDLLRTPPLPHVVLTELRALGASGRTLAVAVRSDPLLEHVGLVAMSGVVDPTWEVVQHFDAYLRKPADFDLLARVVTQVATASRTRNPTPA